MAPPVIIKKAVFLNGGAVSGAGPHKNRAKGKNKVQKPSKAKKGIKEMSITELKKERARLWAAAEKERQEVARKEGLMEEIDKLLEEKEKEAAVTNGVRDVSMA